MSVSPITIKIFDATSGSDFQATSLQLIGNDTKFGLSSAFDLELGKNNTIHIPSGQGLGTIRVLGNEMIPGGSSPSVARAEAKLLNSKTPITLTNGTQYMATKKGPDVVLEPAKPAQLPKQMAPAQNTIELTLLNKTKQLWGQFTMLQFDVSLGDQLTPSLSQAVTVPVSPNVLYIQPFIKAFPVGSTAPAFGNTSTIHDWNTDKKVTLNAAAGKAMRLIGVFPPNDRKYPLRGVLNLTPFVPVTVNGSATYEVHLNKRKTQLKIKPVSQKHPDSDSSSDSD